MATVGVVPYLNAVPLVARLEADVARVVDVPSALSARLERGEIDAALLPVAEALRGVGDGFLGRYGITSDGPVASVLLFLRRPLEGLRRVVLDPASRSSAGMARWVVREAAGSGVRFAWAEEPGPDPAAIDADAVLLIGDPALAYRPRWSGPVLDLGEAWSLKTGLPFVYARWTARAGLEPDARLALARRLDEAASAGVAERARHARLWARERGTDPEAAARYVTRHVGYAIGPREEEGLQRYAAVLGLGAGAARETHRA